MYSTKQGIRGVFVRKKKLGTREIVVVYIARADETGESIKLAKLYKARF